MTKAELVNKIFVKAELGSKAKAEETLNAFTSCLEEALKSDNEVKIKDFGNFKVVERAAREGRNPATGEKINIPASKSVKFTPSKNLKDELNPLNLLYF